MYPDSRKRYCGKFIRLSVRLVRHTLIIVPKRQTPSFHHMVDQGELT